MAKGRIHYVCGFLFSEDLESVVLILKNRPTWLAGKLNGVGGKMKKDETQQEAMVREMKEEAGLKTNIYDWFSLTRVKTSDYTVAFLAGMHPRIADIETVTDERVYVMDINGTGLMQDPRLAPQLSWLIPLAKEFLAGNLDTAHWSL